MSQLKYLFTAQFADGSIYEQDPKDKSLTDPDKRSAYFDVEQRFLSGKPKDQLVSFHLTDGRTLYSVDLTNGRFEINLFSFYIHDTGLDDPKLSGFRLIYFRKVSIHFNVDMEQKGHEIAYRMGWQANDPITGKNYKRIIEFL